MNTKTDPGQKAYEADLAATPRYASSNKPRPQWQDLSPAAQAAWRAKAGADA